MAVENQLLETATAMAKVDKGFDVVIVCTGTATQAAYWNQRLNAVIGSVLKDGTEVICVDEDWDGGAGNGLGTLYAYQKADQAAVKCGKASLTQRLQSGSISAALYHTAGKGTRLAPLPGSENNNKPGVKLPGSVKVDGKESPITILEGVIRQTGAYAASRKGRLSVFWGDQVFIPTASTEYAADFHVDILCSLLPTTPTAEEWEKKKLQSYGLIAMLQSGEGAQVEKVSHADANNLLSALGSIDKCGPSLGSFSVGAEILAGLITEFSSELAAKTGKLDTDPHFWMPMTLPLESYKTLMATKGMCGDEAEKHFDRMNKFKETLSKEKKFFGAVDVGEATYWWDYGQLPKYAEFNLTMVETSAEAAAMRAFFGAEPFDSSKHPRIQGVDVCANSVLSGVCQIKGGSIKKSVLTQVAAVEVTIENALLCNVTAKSIKAAKNSVCYNVVSDGDIVLAEGEVLVGVTRPGEEQLLVKSSLSTDGGKKWKEAVFENAYSFEQILDLNKAVDPAQAFQKLQEAQTACQTKLGFS